MALIVIDPNVIDDQLDARKPPQIGDIQSGWNIKVDATPHDVTDSSGSTGSVSFSAKRRDESDLMIGKTLETIAPSGVTLQGKVTGTSGTNATVAITQDSVLNRMNVSISALPLFQGIHAGVATPDKSSSNATMSGIFRVMPQGDADDKILYGMNVLGSGLYHDPVEDIFLNPALPLAPNITGAESIADPVSSFISTVILDSANRQVQIFRETVSSDNSTFFTLSDPTVNLPTAMALLSSDDAATPGTLEPIAIFIFNYISQKIEKYSMTGTLLGSYGGPGTALGQFNHVTSMVGVHGRGTYYLIVADQGNNRLQVLNMASGMSVVTSFPITSPMSIGMDSGASSNFVVANGTPTVAGFSIIGSIIGPSDNVGFTAQNAVSSVTWQTGPYYFMYTLESDGKIHAYTPAGTSLSQYFLYYMLNGAAGTFKLYFNGEDPFKYYPGWSGNLWDNLKQLCAVTGKEISQNNYFITVDDIDDSDPEQIYQNASGTSLIPSITTGSTARTITVTNQNTSNQNTNLVYSSLADGNNSISLTTGVTTYTTVSTPNWIEPGYDFGDLSTSLMQYSVFDSDGTPVDINDWIASGAGVIASVNSNSQDIDLTLIGPRANIGLTSGTYYLESSPGVSDLRLYAWSLLVQPHDIIMYTGADPSTVTDESGVTVNCPFIISSADAYTVAAWSCQSYSGINLEMDYTVPVGSNATSQQTRPGSFVKNRWQDWRLMSSTFNPIDADVQFSDYTTAGKFDDLWVGLPQSLFESSWAGYRCADQRVRPLWATALDPYVLSRYTNMVLDPNFNNTSTNSAIRTNLIYNARAFGGATVGYGLDLGAGGVGGAYGPGTPLGGIPGLPSGVTTEVYSHFSSGTAPYIGIVVSTANLPGQIVAGSAYTFSAYMLGIGGNAAGGAATVYIQWMNSSGAQVGTTVTAPNGNLNVSAYVRVSASGVAPAGAVSAQIIFRINASVSSSSQAHLTAVMAEKSAYLGPFFDAHTVQTTDFAFGHTGTIDASPSTQTATSLVGVGESPGAQSYKSSLPVIAPMDGRTLSVMHTDAQDAYGWLAVPNTNFPNVSYTAIVLASADVATTTASSSIIQQNGGAFDSMGTIIPSGTVLGPTPQEFRISFTTPFTLSNNLRFVLRTGANGFDICRYDRLALVPIPDLAHPYTDAWFDGDFTDTATKFYNWTGEQSNSPSTYVLATPK